MKDKVKIGLLLTLFLIVCLVIQYFSAHVFDFIILFFSLIATMEFRKLQLKSGNPAFKFVPEISCFLIFVATFVGVLCDLSAVIILIMVFGIEVILYLSILVGSILFTKNDLENDEFRVATNLSVNEFAVFKSNNTLAVMVYPALLIFFVYLINHIQGIGLEALTDNTQGVPMGLFGIVLLFMICCLTDTFAMLFGKWIKGKKLCPSISPNKTISGACFGLVGGIVGALLTYLIFYLIFPSAFSIVYFWQFIIVGLIGSLIAQSGDIFESFLKRRAFVKDAGEFFRSHGGVLDRLDSVVFNAPFIFVCLLFMFG